MHHPLSPAFEVVLVRPEIPPNVGNVARTCAAFGVPLHLVGDLGFSLTDARARRAGVDTWAQLEVHHHASVREVAEVTGGRVIAFSARASRAVADWPFQPGDLLVFGSEQEGLTEEDLAGVVSQEVRIPHGTWVRSLNLATSVGIGCYAALISLRPGLTSR